MTEKLMTVVEAADLLSVSPRTVYALCAAGRLPHHRVGLGRGTIRLKPTALDRFLHQGLVEEAPVARDWVNS